MVIVREWADHDRRSTNALLADVWGSDPVAQGSSAVHGPARDTLGSVSRTLVAQHHGQLVGVGTIHEYWLHPAHWRLSLQIHPAFRRRGIGSVLIEQLARIGAARDTRPLQFATRADNHAGRGFLSHQAFRLLMRTRLGVLDPHLLAPELWTVIDDTTKQVEAMGYRIASMSEFSTSVDISDSLSSLHSEIYRLGHAWNPPASISADLARRLFLDADEVIPDALVMALDGSQPIAVASLRKSKTVSEVELGWVGVDAKHQSQAAPLTTALMGRCLTFSSRQRTLVRTEVDEADRHLWTMMEQLPVTTEPDWITFVRSPS